MCYAPLREQWSVVQQASLFILSGAKNLRLVGRKTRLFAALRVTKTLRQPIQQGKNTTDKLS
jgi:hypothetical protein